MPESDRALARHRTLIARRRNVTGVVLARAFAALGSWDSVDIPRYIAAVTPTLIAAKQSTVASTAAFLSYWLDLTGVTVDPDDVDVSIDLRSPFTATWHSLTEGNLHVDARSTGQAVAQGVGETFVQSTSRRTGDAFQAATGASLRWRRVAEPRACDWCRQRDGGIYLSAEDGDYGHLTCRCDVVPVPA